MSDTDALAARLAALPPEKRALFLQRLKQRKQTADRIPRQSRESGPFPLSPAQERLWFISQVEPHSPVYNLPFAVHLKGEVDVAALRQSLNELGRRHETLRTAIATANGRPQQVIGPELSLPLPVIDLRSLDPPARLEQAKTLMHHEAQRPFDLAQGPLWRASLLHLDENAFTLLVTAHHIVFDGWSVGILHRELWTLYDAAMAGSPATLPELPIQYVDFAVWQRERLQSDALAEQIAYWQTQLEALPVTELPLDKPRPTAQSFAGARQTRTLAPALCRALSELSMAQGVTLFMLLLAAFKTLLYRYTGRTDVGIGTPIAERERPEVTNLIGLFVNTLVVRSRLSPDLAFCQLLQRVRQATAEAHAHQDVPFARLVEVLQPERDTSRAPLFQVMFVLRDDPTKTYEQQQLTIAPQEIRSQTSQFDLTIEIVKAGETLEVAVDYRTSLYRADTIARLLSHLETLLESIAGNPERRLADLEVLTPGERQHLLVEWNATQQPYPAQPGVHRLFEAQAARTPGNVALLCRQDLGEVLAALRASEFDAVLAAASRAGYTPLSTAETGHRLPAQEKAPARRPREASLERMLARCCFERSRLLYKYPTRASDRVAAQSAGAHRFYLLSTHTHLLVAVTASTLSVLDLFDGAHSLAEIAGRLRSPQSCALGLMSVDERTGTLKVEQETTFNIAADYQSWLPLVKALYTLDLIRLAAYDASAAAPTWLNDPPLSDEGPPAAAEGENVIPESSLPAPPGALSPVLLLGATTGSASVGVMYLAAFLRRHGIEAYCQLNDIHTDRDSLRKNMQRLLDRLRPRLVGVSLKWFPHIARALEICRLVKEHAPGVQIVLGGDTATYFADELIRQETVDYVVLGDGEIPLLRICQQAADIPNCVYKRDDGVVAAPIAYLHREETLSQVYLSHLDEIFVSPADLMLAPYVFVFTGRGCPMNCHYCGGACQVQRDVFHRPPPFFALRGQREIRNDIVRLKPYTSTFLFDFDLPGYDSLSAYKVLWAGIDLSAHYAHFYFWALPSPDFIELVAHTFRYVTLNIDLNSLSERHRRCLTRQGVVKPQPTDREVFDFFAECARHANVRTAVNLINGLPFFAEEDIAPAERALAEILGRYSSFEGLGWGRFHAQPGAPVTQDYARFGMQPGAATYQDYLHYSQLNLQEERYPDLTALHYPFIYYQDDRLNSRVTKYYVDTMRTLREHQEAQHKKQRFFDEMVSYAALNRRANQLARYLRRKGVGLEDRVGVYLERSGEMVVAILAVLKAGGAYVPLDPSYPAERLSFMARDARISALLTTEALAPGLALPGVPAVRLDVDGEAISGESPENLDIPIGPNNLAYVLYTSGSTGQPKGVMIRHGGVSNLAQAQAAAFGVQPASRVLQFAPFSFDASVSEIFVTLLAGATLCLAAQDMLLPGPDLVTVLQGQAPTVLTAPPSVWAALPDAGLPHLHTIVSAGEACPPGIVARWANGRRFINAYGPTETTVCATLTACAAGDDGRPPPIGRPIGNTRVYLLDQSLQPVPVGVAGEIHVCAASVARGYWNRPALTAEKFIPNPFPLAGEEGKGARLYKTGDLARYLPDGNIEFLGRLDNQVKIRGSRVEIGEIEAALVRHPAIFESAVVTQDGVGETRLAAYLAVRRGQDAPNTSQLRSFLRTRLPEYMLPYAFVTLDELPRLPNGKVNRQALAVLEHVRPALDEAPVAPRTAIEELIAEIWAHSLNVERVGIYDNFFELGGHSLLITRVISEMAEVFQVELPVRIFLDTPTVLGAAQALIEREPSPGHVDTVARLYRKVRAMSAQEIDRLLHQKKSAG